MDILKFIDSPTVREHNKEYEFNPAEQAVLIAISETATLEEKIHGLFELVAEHGSDDFDDIVLGTNDEKRRCDFYDTIKANIILWQELQSDANTCQQGWVFEANLLCCGDHGNYSGDMFSTLENAYAFLRLEQQRNIDFDEVYRKSTGKHYGEIKRRPLDNFTDEYKDDVLVYDDNLRLIACRPSAWRMKQHPGLKGLLSDDYWVYVPVPFQKGDYIVSKSLYDGEGSGYFNQENIGEETVDFRKKPSDWIEMQVSILPEHSKNDCEISSALVTRIEYPDDIAGGM